MLEDEIRSLAQATIERLLLQTQGTLPIGGTLRGSLEVDIEHLGYELLMKLQGTVLATKVHAADRTYWMRVPASWWQHWKHSHGPHWVTRRWPVRFHEVMLEETSARYRTYPGAKIHLPPKVFGAAVTKEIIQYTQANSSPWLVGHEDDQDAYLSAMELAHQIFQDISLQMPYDEMRLFNMTSVVRILDALKKYGVNPNELVMKKNVS